MKFDVTKSKVYKGDILVYNEKGEHVDTIRGKKDLLNKGFNPSSVYTCADPNGRLKTHKGFYFKREGNDFKKYSRRGNRSGIKPNDITQKHHKPVLTEEEIKNETWVQIKGFEGKYEVSDMGRIKNLSTDQITNGHMNGKYLGWRYDCIKNLSIYVHRLVMEQFSPTDLPNMSVHHKNGNKYDNRLWNLEWIDHTEHSRQHAMENLNFFVKTGKDNPCYKGPVAMFTKEGVLVNIFIGIKDLEERGYLYTNVGKVVRGERKTHKKHIWKRLPKDFQYVLGHKYDLNSL